MSKTTGALKNGAQFVIDITQLVQHGLQRSSGGGETGGVIPVMFDQVMFVLMLSKSCCL